MADQFDPHRTNAPDATRNGGEPDQWTPVQTDDTRHADSSDGPAADAPRQGADNAAGEQPHQQRPQQEPHPQQPQPMYWSQFAAQHMNMDPDFFKLRTVRSQITAANIMGPVSLIFGGMPLALAGIVCAVLAYRGAKKVGEGTSRSAPFAQNFMRSARVSIIICCIAFVLNAVSFAMALPVLIDVVNGDMSALTGMGGLDTGGTTGGSTGDAGSGSSAWG